MGPGAKSLAGGEGAEPPRGSPTLTAMSVGTIAEVSEQRSEATQCPELTCEPRHDACDEFNASRCMKRRWFIEGARLVQRSIVWPPRALAFS